MKKSRCETQLYFRSWFAMVRGKMRDACDWISSAEGQFLSRELAFVRHDIIFITAPERLRKQIDNSRGCESLLLHNKGFCARKLSLFSSDASWHMWRCYLFLPKPFIFFKLLRFQQYCKYSLTVFELLHYRKKEVFIPNTAVQKSIFSKENIEHVADLGTSFRFRTSLSLMLWFNKETIYMGFMGVQSLLQPCCPFLG